MLSPASGNNQFFILVCIPLLAFGFSLRRIFASEYFPFVYVREDITSSFALASCVRDSFDALLICEAKRWEFCGYYIIVGVVVELLGYGYRVSTVL